MTWASELVELIVGMLQNPLALTGFLALSTVTGGIGLYVAVRCLMRWTASKPWWPAAMPRQKHLMLNFGYGEETCTPNAILENWAIVLATCIHHSAAGALLLPVVFLGWTKAAGLGQLLFYWGILMELGGDVVDSIRQTCLRFLPNTFTCMTPVPCLFYVITVVLHHQLSVFMIVPMLLRYPDRSEFHRIACSLLLAAGVSYSTGAYKFTLDTSAPGDFRRYKAVVVLQLVVIYYSRLWLWFSEAFSLLGHFWEEGDDAYLYGALAAAVLMSLFNLTMVADATTAAVKWLPRPMPSDEAGQLDLEVSKSETSAALVGRSFSKRRRSTGRNEGLGIIAMS